jgi:hypothetical protein
MQVKYDLADWEKRKAALLPVLDAAVSEGLVARDQLGRLADFLLGRGVKIGAEPQPAAMALQPESLDRPIASEPVATVEESEAPRFIRGFHDVLITIGIIVALLGLGGLASVYAVIPASVLLAEILVRRQRLALPAVVLTIAFSIACGIGILPLFDDAGATLSEDWFPVILLATTSVATFLFFWRFKAPIALAAGFVAGYGAAVAALMILMVKYNGDEKFFPTHPLMLASFLGVFALLVFGTALRFDFADRLRLTRRSDVAFWMHLAAAPAILYTIMACIYLDGAQGWFSTSTSLMQAVVIVIAVLVLMLIGIVLDRRAFVTSGLLSFGYAFRILLTEGGFSRLISSTDTLAFIVLLAIGIIVLSLGIGWQPLRRIVVAALPEPVARLVPPIRS